MYSSIPEDIHRIQTLVHFDIRLNRIKSPLPAATEGLRNLLRLNVSGNSIPDINTAYAPYLELLNCSGNSLRKLTVSEGPLKSLLAKNNSKLRLPLQIFVLSFFRILGFKLSAFSVHLNTKMSIQIFIIVNVERLKGLVCSIFKSKLSTAEVMLTKLLFLSLFSSVEVTHFSVAPTCSNLTTIDVSGNELTVLPESLAKLTSLGKLNASNNKLTKLPSE